MCESIKYASCILQNMCTNSNYNLKLLPRMRAFVTMCANCAHALQDSQQTWATFKRHAHVHTHTPESVFKYLVKYIKQTCAYCERFQDAVVTFAEFRSMVMTVHNGISRAARYKTGIVRIAHNVHWFAVLWQCDYVHAHESCLVQNYIRQLHTLTTGKNTESTRMCILLC